MPFPSPDTFPSLTLYPGEDKLPAPHEVIVFPLTVYAAPTGTRYPTVDAAEGTFDPAWVKLGTQGARNYDDGGVTATHQQTTATFTGAAATAPRKAFRTAEGFTLGFSLVDLSPAQYALQLDSATITTIAASRGVAGEQNFQVLRGVNVRQFALLARGQSAVDNTLNLQIEAPTVFQSADPAPVFQKGGPAMLAVEYTALEVTAGVFVTVREQTAVAQ